MKEVILHIGIHKTGSTSIQKALKGYNKDGVKAIGFEEENHSIPMYTIFSESRYDYPIWRERNYCRGDIEKKKSDVKDAIRQSNKYELPEFWTPVVATNNEAINNNSIAELEFIEKNSYFLSELFEKREEIFKSQTLDNGAHSVMILFEIWP